ncbi:MAG: enolase C-terminal domain-like protein [Isosphaeraceae bacterium]
MPKPTDIRPVAVELYFLPIKTRVPLKFGPEITTEVTCARVKLTVEDSGRRKAVGWGETPLSVQWVWPSHLGYEERHDALRNLSIRIAEAWIPTPCPPGHPMEVGHDFLERVLPRVTSRFNETERKSFEPVPYLGALVCASAFDLALHDAYGVLHQVPTYDTYNRHYMNVDLSRLLKDAPTAEEVSRLLGGESRNSDLSALPAADAGSGVSFEGRFPEEFLVRPRLESIPAWHLVGGKDPVDTWDLTGSEPDDGYPVLLRDWIRRDGLKCLKVKLRGDDADWDYDRLLKVGRIAVEEGVDWLTADFNCTVNEPAYVNAILDRLMAEHPRLYGMLLYVEQPFPYDLEAHRIDVHSVSARKPLFMDESAHDWRFVRLGRELGWSGVALKTCKTQTGALLSLCWAKAHGMTLMVQDLSNPMLAQVSHVLLAAHAGTIMGVESNGMQFYPAASLPEEAVHPGLFRRRDGKLDLSSVRGPGFGYRLEEIERTLPAPELSRGG